MAKSTVSGSKDRRQRVRRLLILVSFLLFPLTIFYFSPALIVVGAFEGVLAGSALMFAAQLLSAMVLRRAFCGWLCPAGGLQEMAATVVGKPAKLGWRSYLKYAIWVPWMVSIVAGAWFAGGFSVVDPMYHTTNGISVGNLMALAIYFGIVALFFIPNLFMGRRAMCHCICWMAPFMVIGEKLGSAFRIPQLHIEAEPERCITCGKCTKACPMSLDVEALLQEGGIADAECVQCAACADACPKGALALRVERVNSSTKGVGR